MCYRHLFFGVLCLLGTTVSAMQTAEIDLLDCELQRKAEYDRQKHLRIQAIEQDPSISTYDKYVLLFEE